MKEIDRIVSGCLNGDSKCQLELYNNYSPRFYALCLRYLGDTALAKDALVEGFISIYRNIENFRNEGSFETWMNRIFINQCLNQIRDNQRRKTISIKEEDPPTTISDIILHIDVQKALDESLAQLSDEERLVFNMIAVDEYTFADAAEMLNTNESAIKTRYYKAKDKMKHQMSLRLGHNYTEN